MHVNDASGRAALAILASPMPRFSLTVAYDGTNFCGWQKQEPPLAHAAGGAGRAAPPPLNPELFLAATETDTVADGRVALRTVQAVLERAVREVVREPIILTGASRTDAGVHAIGQVAAFTCSGDEAEQGAIESAARSTGWPVARGMERLVKAINSRLPEDCLVLGAQPVHAEFDAVRWAVRKQYVYTIRVSPLNSYMRPIFDRNRVYSTHDLLDVASMQRAAEQLLGTHDCVGLSAASHGRLTTVRTIESCSVELINVAQVLPDTFARPTFVSIRICGTGFLYNMVRIIAGTLLDVGRGRLSEDVFARVFASKDRRLAGPTLPASGLCLEWIEHGQGPAGNESSG